MKKYVYMAVAVVAVGVVTFAFMSKGHAKALGVNDVASDPAAFKGTITITGIMAGVSQHDPTVFGIMDKKELQCTTPGCNKLYLPVRTSGKMPVPGDEVRATGSFTKEQGGILFTAENVVVVKTTRSEDR